MIVKCQRSLVTTELSGGPQLLLYDRTYEWIMQCSMPPDWDARFGPTTSLEDNRFFAEVRWTDRYKAPVFLRRLPEQFW